MVGIAVGGQGRSERGGEEGRRGGGRRGDVGGREGGREAYVVHSIAGLPLCLGCCGCGALG